MKISLTISLLFGLCFGYAAPSPQLVASDVKSVTVFLDGAQVNRIARVSLQTGDVRYRLEQLSPYIDPQSIRVAAKGDLIIKSVFFQRNYLDSLQKTRETATLL